MKDSNRYCVIMCGGVGTRFWPFSREDKPKQFLDFLGTGRSLIQMTVDRIRPLVSSDHIFFVTNKDYVDMIHEQMPDIPMKNILAEPARRNTAPCLCWAAHHISAINPEATMVVLPSDHLILKEAEFLAALQEGLEFVEQQPNLLTLGIKPHYPNTGYGYIQAVMACTDFPDILKVKSFTEKPDKQMAELFLRTGEFYWNSGIFLWKASTLLEAFARLDPEVAGVFDAPAGVYGTPAEKDFIAMEFPKAPSISIDYSIMEKASNVYLRTVDIGWSDLGTWKALYEASPKSQDGNVMQNSKVLARNCHDTIFAIGGDKIVVAEGLDDFIVADNENALLIVPKSEEQRIRQIVNEVHSRFGQDYI